MVQAVSLWHQFNLAEANPSQAGGLLYAMRYSSEEIEAKREIVIAALERIGVTLEDMDEDGIGVALSDDAARDQALALLEELSVENDAVAYHLAGYGQYHTISELCTGLKGNYLELLTHGKPNMVAAYNLATLVIPEIVRDLRSADVQNNVLSARDRKELDALEQFARTKDRQLNSGGVMIG
jgi:hypothetical protein